MVSSEPGIPELLLTGTQPKGIACALNALHYTFVCLPSEKTLLNNVRSIAGGVFFDGSKFGFCTLAKCYYTFDCFHRIGF